MEYLMLIGGLALLILSGNFLVSSASDIARQLKLSSLVKKAKDVHDELEAFYKEAMDFGKTDEIFESTISRFYR